ncbi:hypothetical protein [Pseudomonas shahriarae]|jgi:hypothetical protein|uniref:Type III secretion effector protein n=1 Tax=Pseudomonas shahriarae TaxID=2745512 RepID=A0ABT5NIW2_9PSED|nr:hypothetical protein [Pseudomonas shahriarae]MDD0988301.1 hypothetical protein [Pseudomonas shahriarae]MDD1034566.1 hypothetical protein [Pseudomonas shahriarae]
MSVPAFNQPVVNLPNDAMRYEAEANTTGAAASAAGPAAKGPSFSGPESKSGPVFAAAQPMAQGAAGVQADAARGGKPPLPGSPPPRPFPQQPDPIYSKRSHDQLAQQLLDNFKAFNDPKNPDYITPQGLKAKAETPLTKYPHKNQDIRLAREIMKRPDLLKALDRDGRTGGLDAQISRQNIYDVIRSDNPLKYKDDEQLAKDMLKNFNQLKGSFWSKDIKVADLNARAQRPLTGNPHRDQLTHLAREVFNRSNLLQQMDNVASPDYDGRISKRGLKKLSH